MAWTLLDLAAVVSRDSLERACERAENLRLFDLRAVKEVIDRSRGRRGVARLRAVIAEVDDEPAFTRSELERRFLTLCRDLGLPAPSVNAWIDLSAGGLEADFAWPEQRIVVELDSHRFHGSRSAFERDRRRDQQLTADGYRFARFTWRQITDWRWEVAEILHALFRLPV